MLCPGEQLPRILAPLPGLAQVTAADYRVRVVTDDELVIDSGDRVGLFGPVENIDLIYAGVHPADDVRAEEAADVDPPVRAETDRLRRHRRGQDTRGPVRHAAGERVEEDVAAIGPEGYQRVDGRVIGRPGGHD